MSNDTAAVGKGRAEDSNIDSDDSGGQVCGSPTEIQACGSWVTLADGAGEKPSKFSKIEAIVNDIDTEEDAKKPIGEVDVDGNETTAVGEVELVSSRKIEQNAKEHITVKKITDKVIDEQTVVTVISELISETERVEEPQKELSLGSLVVKISCVQENSSADDFEETKKRSRLDRFKEEQKKLGIRSVEEAENNNKFRVPKIVERRTSSAGTLKRSVPLLESDRVKKMGKKLRLQITGTENMTNPNKDFENHKVTTTIRLEKAELVAKLAVVDEEIKKLDDKMEHQEADSGNGNDDEMEQPSYQSL